MDAKELMIGDWVEVTRTECVADGGHYITWSEYGKVIGITDSYIEVKVRDGEYNVDAHEDELKPISLTPEILEKNGFVKYNEVSDTPPYDKDEEGNMYYSYKGEQKFWGWWQPNSVYLIPVNAMIDLEIKYVHQLQHALRLCGINKEIET